MTTATKQMATADDLAKRLSAIHAAQNELTSSPWSHDVIELALAVATSLSVSQSDDTAISFEISVPYRKS